MDLWDKAADLTVDIALIYNPPEPVDPAGTNGGRCHPPS